MPSVLSVASEAYPLIKTGGLADVAGALPPALVYANPAFLRSCRAPEGLRDGPLLQLYAADLLRAPDGLQLAVNVSARQLAEPGFAEAAAAIVRAHGLDPQRLTLELTESVAVSTVAPGAEIEALRRHGFRLVLDDFGTEYAVLSHIGSGHFDGIKLSHRQALVDAGYVVYLHDHRGHGATLADGEPGLIRTLRGEGYVFDAKVSA